jgi:hypothetical protein
MPQRPLSPTLRSKQETTTPPRDRILSAPHCSRTTTIHNTTNRSHFFEEEEEEEDNANVSFDADIFDNNYDDIDDDGVDANVNDYAADKYDFNTRMHHYMGYSAISSRNVRAVEYCCMTQANTIVCNHQTKGRVELDEEHLKVYLELVRDIPDSYFVNHTVKAEMLKGYVGMRGKKTGAGAAANGKRTAIAAAPFARREKKVVSKVRLFASNFPKILPSGQTPCDVRKAFIVKVWKANKHATKKGKEVRCHVYWFTVKNMSLLTF